MKNSINRKIILTLFLVAFTQGGCGVENFDKKEKGPIPVRGTIPSSVTLSGNEELTLIVNFNNVSNEGSVCSSIFNDENSFPENASGAIGAKCVPASEAREKGITFEGLKASTSYAVSAFHDVNNNGQLDTRPVLTFKVPNEPYGFSRNPGITRIGPPLFSETSIILEGSPANITINLKRFLE